MTTRDDIIREARARLGIPYGLPPGPGETDCSLYVLDVFKAAGIRA
jgi:cell wall-associated NlpC family hydrolase